MKRAIPQDSDRCTGCGQRYGSWLKGTWHTGRGVSYKADAWAEHKRVCEGGFEAVPFDVQSTLRDRAEGWLENHLSLGPAPARDVIAAAKAAGIGKRTLDYAKRAIGVECKRISSGNRGAGCWEWSLPAEERERVAA